MKGIRYTAEFKAEAIKQITERGHNTANVAERLGISTKSIYKWIKEAELRKQPAVNKEVAALKQEVIRLNAALKRTTEERDILKKATMAFFNISRSSRAIANSRSNSRIRN